MRINQGTKPAKGRAIIEVQLNDPNKTPPEDTYVLLHKRDIVSECNNSLGNRFQLGTHSYQPQMVSFSFRHTYSNTDMTDQLLEGSYSCDPDSDPYTIHFFEKLHGVVLTSRVVKLYLAARLGLQISWTTEKLLKREPPLLTLDNTLVTTRQLVHHLH